MGDMPDFENMTPEETMRWLESLAKRQGGDERGFTTSADMEVAEIDPNSVVIDEPGYTPSEGSSKKTQAQPAPAAQATPIPTPAPTPEPVQATPQSQPMASAATASDADTNLAEMDPIAWLESLAKRQGATEGFTTAADMEIPEIDPSTVVIDEPGYTPSEGAGKKRAETKVEAEPSTQAQPMQAEPAMAEVEIMAEIEAATEEAVYEEALYIVYYDEAQQQYFEYDPQNPPIPAPSYIFYYDHERQEYVPYDPSVGIVAVELEPSQPEPTPVATTQSSTTAGMMDGELPADIDPMEWLESLAKRQGGDERGFLTKASLDVPEIDASTVVIDEPGYTPSEKFGTTGAASKAPEASAPPATTSKPAPASSVETEDGGGELSWLEELAKDQGADAADFLSEIVDEAILPGFDFIDEEPTPHDAALAASLAIPTMADEDDLLGGMSDEDIARAQAAGLLTPEQELAWLKSKISSYPTSDIEDEIFDDDAPAIEAELPDWLKQQMPSDLEAAPLSSGKPSLIDDIILPTIPSDFPDWLTEDIANPSEEVIDLPEFTLENVEPTPYAKSVTQEAAALISDYNPDEDHWAAALDEEFELRHKGVDIFEDEPEWYAKAMADAEGSLAFEPEAPEQGAPQTPQRPIKKQTGELPDWLRGAEFEAPAPAADSDMPDWLQGTDTNFLADVNAWLIEQEVSTPTAATPSPAASFEAPTSEFSADAVDLSFLETDTVQSGGYIETSGLDFLDELTPKNIITSLETDELAIPSAPEERLDEGEEGELPSWYVGVGAPSKPPVAAQPAPKPPVPSAPQPPRAVPTTPPPPSVPTVRPSVPLYTSQPTPTPALIAPVPAAPELAEFKSKLDSNPNDYDTRLQLARALRTKGDVMASVAQYETLVEHSVMLETVANDLNATPHPHARRLLGDVYMRLGRLQEALDTYRNALNQL